VTQFIDRVQGHVPVSPVVICITMDE